MSTRILAVVTAFAGTACASPPRTIRPTPVVPAPQTRLGSAGGFSPGIARATPLAVSFVMDTAAQVIVLRVSRTAGVEAAWPVHGFDRTRLAPGAYRIVAPSVAALLRAPSSQRVSDAPSSECVRGAAHSAAVRPPEGSEQRSYEECVRAERSRTSIFQRARPTPAPPVDDAADGYWLVIVSDVATRAADLRRRLDAMEISDSTLTAVRALPEGLVGGRTTRWAAFYAPFGRPTP